MKTRSERLRHRRSLPLESLENRNLLSQVIAGLPAEVRLDQVMVPFKLSFEGSRTVSYPEPLPSPLRTITVEADGTATDWGPYHLSEQHTLKFTSPTTVDIYGGTATFTLKSGDTVSATYSGSGHVVPTPPGATPPTLVIELNYTITGGTGRYDEATGAFHLTLTINDALNSDSVPVSATGTGHIAPPTHAAHQ